MEPSKSMINPPELRSLPSKLNPIKSYKLKIYLGNEISQNEISQINRHHVSLFQLKIFLNESTKLY